MSFQIQMLGTGNAFAKKYYNNNALIVTPSIKLLIDFGITGPAALFAAGKSFADIDGVLITHLHGDHIGGLEELAFQFKYILNKKPKLYIPEILVKPLWENSLKAGLEDAKNHELADFFHIFLLDENETNHVSGDLQVKLFQTDHIPGKTSFSLLINDCLFYSADMKFNPNLLHDLYEQGKCSVIFHDCQLVGPGIVHASLEEMLTLPESIQRITYLMHYNDNMEDFRSKTGLMQFVEQHKIYTINA